MLTFSILTLFPELITTYCTESIIGRGQSAGSIAIETVNPRDFTTSIHKKVDDSPYGGGSGMVMQCEPLDLALKSLLPLKKKARVLITTPVGEPFNHKKAQELATAEQIVILCGHYEGIDHRIYALLQQEYDITLEPISIGDFVLTGGELAALSIVDSVSRLIPGVVQKQDSVEQDSFFNGLLDHPHYTRPATYKGISIPTVLLSGNHQHIETWRHEQSLTLTQDRRPDLLKNVTLTKKEEQWLSSKQKPAKPLISD